MFQEEAIPCITRGEEHSTWKNSEFNRAGVKGAQNVAGMAARAKPKQALLLDSKALLLDSDFALGTTEGHFTFGYQGSILISVKTESYKSLFKKEKSEMRYEPPFMKRISFN